MAYDISAAVAPALNSGAVMPLLDPAGVPIENEDGTPLTITLVARNSVKGLAALRANANRRMAEARRGQQSGVERNEADATEVLAACTIAWTIELLDGAAFSCTPDNARKLYSDDRFRRWREQADDFISSEANFIKA
jgi:hypothetical protein